MLYSAFKIWRYYRIYRSIFGFWTKQDILGRHLGLWETVIHILHHFLTFYRQLVQKQFTSCSSTPVKMDMSFSDLLLMNKIHLMDIFNTGLFTMDVEVKSPFN